MDVGYEKLLTQGTMNFGTSRSIDLQHLHECKVSNGMKHKNEQGKTGSRSSSVGLAWNSRLYYVIVLAGRFNSACKTHGASPRRPE